MKRKSLFFAVFSLFFLLAGVHAEDDRDTSNPYGVLDFLQWDHDWNAHHYSWDQIVQAIHLMRDAHVGMVRMDFLWADIEPEPDVYDFEKYDKIVHILRVNGIRVVGLLDYNPVWQGGNWNGPPDPKLYTQYATAVVHHFKDRIMYWEIWNEPDSPDYWLPQDNLTTYCDLLKRVYPAIKAEDPNSVVLEGSLSQMILTNQRAIYEKAGAQSFDVVNIHAFPNPLDNSAIAQLKDQVESLRKIMKENGDEDKPIWVTEFGAPGVPAGDKHSWWHGGCPTEAQQARWVKTAMPEVASWAGVEKVFWAFFRDTDDYFMNGVDYFGLLRKDLSLKPSYTAYKEVASEPDVKEDPAK